MTLRGLLFIGVLLVALCAARVAISSATQEDALRNSPPNGELQQYLKYAENVSPLHSITAISHTLFMWAEGLYSDAFNFFEACFHSCEVQEAIRIITPPPKVLRVLAALGWMMIDLVPVAFMLWYSRLLVGSPEVDGSQFRPKVVDFLRRQIFPSYEKYFDLTLRLEEPVQTELSKGGGGGRVVSGSQYFFAYHPHGIFPNTVVWLHHSNVWNNVVKIPGDSIVSFGASIIFNTPFLRDLALTCGSREVSQNAIEAAIRQGKSPVLVPGGQSEMIHSWPGTRELHIVTYHRGFVRLAMKYKIPLVPVLCFGEHNTYYNVYMPKVQYWFLKRMGVGFPVLPIGWKFLPLPNRTPLNAVVGAPLDTTCIGDRHLDYADPTDVAAMADVYFARLKAIFYQYREECGFPHMQLFYHNDKRNPMRGALQLPSNPLTQQKQTVGHEPKNDRTSKSKGKPHQKGKPLK